MNNKISKFEDLECWKEARILVKLVYKATNLHLFSKDFGLKDQVQRAAVSVMSNIAEGFGAYSEQEFIRYLSIALRSCNEVLSQAYIANDINYITAEEFEYINIHVNKCSALTKGLIKYLKTRKLIKDKT